MRTHRSHSELDTFEKCAIQHFYRYGLRLESRAYSDNRARVIGSIHGAAKESLYLAKPPRGRPIDPDLVKAAVNAAAEPYREQYSKSPASKWFDEHAFEVDVHVAYKMAMLFSTDIFATETYEVLAVEHPFVVNLGGHSVRGYLDALLRATEGPLEGQLLVGEDKTRSNSWNQKLEEMVPTDPQVAMYHAALKAQGTPAAGTVYTIYKKPPAKLMKVDNYERGARGLKQQLKDIDGYYSRARTVVRRAEIAHVVETEGLGDTLDKRIKRVNRFYENLDRNLHFFVKPDPTKFPCTFCDYASICLDGQPIDSRYVLRIDSGRPAAAPQP